MTFYPARKTRGVFGTVFFGLCLLAVYRYSHVHKISYAVIALLTICISVYQLVPVFRNQVVEITSDGIIIHSFGKKIGLTKADQFEVEYRHTCIATYHFNQGGRYYQLTPIGYARGEELLQEFIRLFGS